MAMAVMEEATAKLFRVIRHATRLLRLNTGIVSFGQVAGYAQLVARPRVLIPINLQAVVLATAICDAIIGGLSGLGLRTVVLAVHAAQLRVVALVADGANTLNGINTPFNVLFPAWRIRAEKRSF